MKDESIIDKSHFLQIAADKKTWAKYLDPGFRKFLSREFSAIQGAKETFLVMEMNAKYIAMVKSVEEFSRENKNLYSKKFDKQDMILEENRIVKNEVLEMALLIDELRELSIVQDLKIEGLIEIFQG